MIPFIVNAQNRQVHRDRKNSFYPELKVEGRESDYLMGMGFWGAWGGVGQG